MKKFRDYLQTRPYQPRTVGAIIRSAKEYRRWISERGMTVYTANSATAVEYLEFLRNNRLKPGTINQKLGFLRQYYHSLSTSKNPFTGLQLKGTKKKVHVNLFTEDELQNLYMGLPESTENERRNKILAGLYIFQGVSSTEVRMLLKSHLQLNKGAVVIPHTRRSNERVLPLNPLQMILLLREYSTPDSEDAAIYHSLGTARQFAWIVGQLNEALNYYPRYKNLFQIRHSVVMNWLKRHNLRQVQYNAGHRYISTTERYLESDYEELKAAILERHPLG